MAIDQNKIKKAAQKAVDRGQYDKAIHLLQKLIGRNTRDTRTLLKIGDLQRRKGDDRDAAKTLREVGEIYTEQGFFLKAVAVYKQVLKLTPNDIDVKLRLAEMYERLELVTEALATYEETVTLYARDGNVVKVLETLERMVKLDPDNVVVRIKYAEALSRDGRSSAAATQFEKSGELLQAQGRHEDFMKVGERLLYHRPDDIVLARKLATMYLERSDPKRALAKLQTCFRANASDVETLALLADAFEQLHQVPKAISVYREIARIQGERGEEIDRDRALRRIMSLAPTDALARETLAEIEARAAARTSDHLTIPAPGVYEPPDEASEPVIEVRAAAVSDLPPEPEEVLSDPAAAAWTRAPAALSDYADYDGGEDDEDDLDVPSDPAAAAWTRAPAALSDYEGDDDELELSSHPAGDALDDLEPDADEGVLFLAEDEDDSVLFVADDGQLAAEADDDGDESAREGGAPAQRPPPVHDAARAAALEAASASDEDDDEGPGEMLRITLPPIAELEALAADEADGGETLEGLPVTTVPQPANGHAAHLDPHVRAALRSVSPSDFEQAEVRELSDEERRAEENRLQERPATEVEEALDEADFFAARGLYGEARETLRELLESRPAHALLLDKLDEIDELAKTDAEAGYEDVELVADALGQDFEQDVSGANPQPEGADELDVEQVFAEFKTEIRAQVSPDDTSTHFDLGIAYREMGLYDDAIEQFEMAAASREHEPMCRLMVGLCELDRGDAAAAIRSLEAGLDAEAITPTESLGLRYEIGVIYENQGDAANAARYFRAVAKVDPAFRDVRAKLERLEAGAPAM
ncbi:MAG: tetratricopeptide repeat protein [Myxococcales bacterium]|nr:tetratricopeptide repeat protein [Myxococcales bacterium]